MKNLEQLTHQEKARLLFDLFPTELKACIDFIQAVAETITEDQDKQRKDWTNRLFTFEAWFAQVKAVKQEIEELKSRPKTKQLQYLSVFEGTKAWFTVYCMSLYTTTRQHPNLKFVTAVALFFN